MHFMLSNTLPQSFISNRGVCVLRPPRRPSGGRGLLTTVVTHVNNVLHRRLHLFSETRSEWCNLTTDKNSSVLSHLVRIGEFMPVIQTGGAAQPRRSSHNADSFMGTTVTESSTIKKIIECCRPALSFALTLNRNVRAHRSLETITGLIITAFTHRGNDLAWKYWLSAFLSRAFITMKRAAKEKLVCLQIGMCVKVKPRHVSDDAALHARALVALNDTGSFSALAGSRFAELAENRRGGRRRRPRRPPALNYNYHVYCSVTREHRFTAAWIFSLCIPTSSHRLFISTTSARMHRDTPVVARDKLGRSRDRLPTGLMLPLGQVSAPPTLIALNETQYTA
ncbi:hypothetical protein EVAR_41333_1 [Eumeta japonica]|uniref:Uncharacterized protein n=1 Tax=Eumeta variegata TaxID=151549 RepID=A0A4C1X4Y9_EUMVA|nr:hypothetical protein EVAR_41333_1 [Eumeta japonica]